MYFRDTILEASNLTDPILEGLLAPLSEADIKGAISGVFEKLRRLFLRLIEFIKSKFIKKNVAEKVMEDVQKQDIPSEKIVKKYRYYYYDLNKSEYNKIMDNISKVIRDLSNFQVVGSSNYTIGSKEYWLSAIGVHDLDSLNDTLVTKVTGKEGTAIETLNELKARTAQIANFITVVNKQSAHINKILGQWRDGTDLGKRTINAFNAIYSTFATISKIFAQVKAHYDHLAINIKRDLGISTDEDNE